MFGFEVGLCQMSSDVYCMECKDRDIEIIDMAVNVDHVHLFVKYPPKYSVSFMVKRMKKDMWMNMIRICNTILNFSRYHAYTI